MKQVQFPPSLRILMLLGLCSLTGCARLGLSGPDSPLPTPTPGLSPSVPVCWLFSPVALPLSPLGNGNYVIKGIPDWEAYNNCSSGPTCPIPPVDLGRSEEHTSEL